MRLGPLLLVLAACTTAPPQGELTHSTCPSTDPPTYDSFGVTFFASYCLECHASTRTGADRQGAPPTIDFDTRALVRANTSDVDRQAAYGPSASNRLMPPDGHPKPSDQERTTLGAYIACEVRN
jgi:uncharacterized membrane protein